MGKRSRAIDPTTVPTRRQADTCRLSIKSTHIIRRLQQHLDGELETPLTPTQVQAGKILLDRTVPVLQAMEITQGDLPPEESAEEVMEQMREAVKEYVEKLPEHMKQELLGENVINIKTAQS